MDSAPVDVDALKSRVLTALAAVEGPGGESNAVASGGVRDVQVDEVGAVRIAVSAAPSDQGAWARRVREAAEAVDGVATVKINVQLPQTAPASPPAGRGGGLRPGSVPAPTPRPGLLPKVGHVIAVSSGKGGVGKSMVAASLAAAWAKEGKRVGLLDADIYGPNIPTMFGVTQRPAVSGEKGQEMITPIQAHGVLLMSLGFLLEKEQPAIMRGPLISGILKQFLEQVAWGELDTLVVDMPPGTGDAQLSLVQTIDLDGAVMVTTPQAVSTGDVRRGVKMFERVNTRVLGIVENMSGFTCPSCDEEHELFGRGGGQALAEELSVPFLGSVPLDPRVRVSGDQGTPAVLAHPDIPATRALMDVAQAVTDRLD